MLLGKSFEAGPPRRRRLALGSSVIVQTQRGPNKGRWKTSFTVVDVLEHNFYLVKMDGSVWLSKTGAK